MNTFLRWFALASCCCMFVGALALLLKSRKVLALLLAALLASTGFAGVAVLMGHATSVCSNNTSERNGGC